MRGLQRAPDAVTPVWSLEHSKPTPWAQEPLQIGVEQGHDEQELRPRRRPLMSQGSDPLILTYLPAFIYLTS